MPSWNSKEYNQYPSIGLAIPPPPPAVLKYGYSYAIYINEHSVADRSCDSIDAKRTTKAVRHIIWMQNRNNEL